jgi:methylthioribose-1-phosphate isomerase
MPMSDAPYQPITFEGDHIRLLDQTLLPHEERYIELGDVEATAEAIRSMRVRGAPAIGITAAYGVALAARQAPDGPDGSVLKAVERAAGVLGATRPTAVNLEWALRRMVARVAAIEGDGSARAGAVEEATRIHEEQSEADWWIAEAGAALLDGAAAVLTHCNTGPLATGGLGTALAIVIQAHRARGLRHVFVDETRPRLQGARLTTWELQRHGVPHELIVDGAAASLIAAGAIDAVVVGADRIARNGDTANKIGTLSAALAAHHFNVPFYVAAPVSTIDPAAGSGGDIDIEERAAEEVLSPGGVALAPGGTEVRNPAFDVTPADLITAIITERGVLEAPYETSIGTVLAGVARA